MEAAYKVYYAAEKYMLPKLTALCVQYISTHLSATNVCKAYEFSKFYKNSDLEKKCVEILSRKTKEVLASDEFYEANISTVVELFDMPHLNIPSEMTLFVAAERYHSSHRDTAQLKGSSPTLTIHNAVEKIRFLTLSPQEFASSIRGTSLLSETDKFSLLMNISSSESGAPMPQGFSTSKQKRTLKSSEILSGKHYYILVSTEDQKLDEMGEMHEAYRGNIIICNTRNTVDLVGSHIVEYGYSEYYHYRDSTYNSTMQCVFEGMSQSNIQTAIRKHASDHSTLIIMASLIGKVKLTKEKCVILYDPPADAKDYPRFVTKNGLTVTLVTPQQQGIIQDIEDMHCVEMWRYDKVTEAIQNFYDSTS